jgi:hypothetical protein
MKLRKIIVLAMLFSVSAFSAAADNYGTYTNGKVTITYDMGARGGDIFKTSACKGEYRPAFDGSTDMHIGDKRSYVIYFQGSPAHMEIEGNSKCFPQGRYKKTK